MVPAAAIHAGRADEDAGGDRVSWYRQSLSSSVAVVDLRLHRLLGRYCLRMWLFSPYPAPSRSSDSLGSRQSNSWSSMSPFVPASRASQQTTRRRNSVGMLSKRSLSSLLAPTWSGHTCRRQVSKRDMQVQLGRTPPVGWEDGAALLTCQIWYVGRGLRSLSGLCMYFLPTWRHAYYRYRTVELSY